MRNWLGGFWKRGKIRVLVGRLMVATGITLVIGIMICNWDNACG